MSEQETGIDLMRARIERGRRRPPEPRRASERAAREVATPGNAPPDPTEAAVAPTGADPRPPAMPSTRVPRGGQAPRTARRGGEGPLRLSPQAPWANLAIRVRRPLDDRLVELVHALRREGVRTSKVELVEMLLWELTPEADADLRARIARFRRFAPRASGAELDT